MTKTKTKPVRVRMPNPRTGADVKIDFEDVFTFVNNPDNANRTLADCIADFDIFCDARKGGGFATGEPTFVMGTQPVAITEADFTQGTACIPALMRCGESYQWYITDGMDNNRLLPDGSPNPTYRHLLTRVAGITFPPKKGGVASLFNSYCDLAMKARYERKRVNEGNVKVLQDLTNQWNDEHMANGLSLADSIAENKKREAKFKADARVAFETRWNPPVEMQGFVDAEKGDGSAMQAGIAQLDADKIAYKTPNTAS